MRNKIQTYNPEGSADWYRLLSEKKSKRPKYGNKKVIIDGHTFDSTFEADRYCYLKMLQRAGAIKNLELQPEYELQPGFRKNGKWILPIKYKADFKYQERDGQLVIEDTKGLKTEAYKIKKKLFEFKYPELTIVEIERKK